MSVLTPASRPSRVVELPSVPGLTALYGKAVLPSPRDIAGAVSSKLPFGKSAVPTVEASTLRLPDVTYLVRGVKGEPSHIVDYQRLLGEPVSDALPAGYVHVLGFPVAMALMVSAEFPLPVMGMVHLRNSVSVARTISTGEQLNILAWAQNMTGHAKGTTVELVVEAYADEEVVWRGVSTYLAKGKYLVGRGDESGQIDRAEFSAPLPTGRWQLGGSIGRQYAAVSGDRNPIHMSALTAKAFGFPRAIAHGMYTAARALSEAGRMRPDAYEWTVEFAKPVLLPGKVDVSIRGDAGVGGTGAVTYAGWNGKSGKVHFTGKITPLG